MGGEVDVSTLQDKRQKRAQVPIFIGGLKGLVKKVK